VLAQVRVLDGAINGIRVRFIDTPGLQAAASAVGYNARVLGQIRKAHRKYKPDNVLYFDRMDKVRSLVLIALLCFWLAFPVRQSLYLSVYPKWHVFHVCTDQKFKHRHRKLLEEIRGASAPGDEVLMGIFE
jgi:hypothetical protein